MTAHTTWKPRSEPRRMAVAVAEVARDGVDGAGLELAAEDVHAEPSP